MGLDRNGARFLLHCRKLDVDFTRTAMTRAIGETLLRARLKA
jgi:hypothetical protein